MPSTAADVYRQQDQDAAFSKINPLNPNTVTSVYPSPPQITEYKVIPTIFEAPIQPQPVIYKTIEKPVYVPYERVVEKPVEHVIEHVIEPDNDGKDFIHKLDKLQDKIQDIYDRRK